MKTAERHNWDEKTRSETRKGASGGHSRALSVGQLFILLIAGACRTERSPQG